MLRIRLQRTGRSNRAFYRIVLTEHTSPAKTGALALFGNYDPLASKDALKVDTQAILEWIKKGAKPTNTIARLLKGAGVAGMEPFIVEMKSRKKKGAADEPALAAAPSQEPAAA